MIDGLTVIVPFRNGHSTLGRLLASLPLDLPIIVVDDQSDEPLGHLPRATVIRRPSRGYFAGAVNAGIAACTTDVLVLNQDVWLEGDAWQHYIDARRTYAIAGDPVKGHPAWPMGYVQGTFMYLRREALGAVGDLNERDFPLWGGTAEWQARACRKGYKAAPAPVPGLHHERVGPYGASIATALHDEPARTNLLVRTPPLVTVVIPCYNYGRYLADAVNSLRGGPTCIGEATGQTFAAWEAVIVDDHSTDDSWAIAQQLADPWQGIHAIRTPKNGGTPLANNTGIGWGHGRYWTHLSADDMLPPDALRTLYDVVAADLRAVPYGDQQLVRDKGIDKPYPLREFDPVAILERNMVPAGIMATKAAWQAVGGYPLAFKWGREDWAMAVQLAKHGYCPQHLPKMLYYYRRQGQNRTERNVTTEWRATFLQQMREQFPSLYDGSETMACCGHGSKPAQPKPAARGTGVRSQAEVVRQTRAQMVLLQYVGGNAGNTSWWGDETGMKYRFGPSQPVSYVYASDVEGMLAKRVGQHAVFRLYTAPVETPPVVTLETGKAEVEAEAEAMVEQAPAFAGAQDEAYMVSRIPEPVVIALPAQPAPKRKPKAKKGAGV